MIYIAICEDDPTHSRIVKKIIKNNISNPFQMYTFSSAEEFRNAVFSKNKKFDLVIMDIELGDDSGIALSRELNNHCSDVQIIFISQYLEYVSDVYETDHIFFIDKKNIDVYLPLALKKALDKIHLCRNLYLSFTWHNESFEILQKDILYMERVLRKTEIHTASKIYTTSAKLSVLEEKLDNYFIITHRSFLVNLRAVTSFDKKIACLHSGIEIPISRPRYNEVKKRLNLLFS